MSRKATHRGTCQACDRVQMLPGGRLAKHGYTKRWGFLSGTCIGSHREPLEVSRDLVTKCIARSENTVVNLQRQREEILASETRAWKRIYDQAGNRYEWRPGTVAVHEQDFSDGSKLHGFTWTDASPKTLACPLREHINTSLQDHDVVSVIKKLNSNYVKNVTNRDINRHILYIAWQRKRHADWLPKPLLPVSDNSDERRKSVAKLTAAGCRHKPHGYAGTLGWFTVDGKYLGRGAQQALAALKAK